MQFLWSWTQVAEKADLTLSTPLSMKLHCPLHSDAGVRSRGGSRLLSSFYYWISYRQKRCFIISSQGEKLEDHILYLILTLCSWDNQSLCKQYVLRITSLPRKYLFLCKQTHKRTNPYTRCFFLCLLQLAFPLATEQMYRNKSAFSPALWLKQSWSYPKAHCLVKCHQIYFIWFGKQL